MKKYMLLLVISLLAALFIYVFYRSEKTVVNYITIRLFSADAYYSMKDMINLALPLPDFVVYSLPEGLWVFCITVTSSYFYVEVKNFKISLTVVPLLLSVVMEILQLTCVLNGRFDVLDIIFAAGFWVIGVVLTQRHLSKEPLFNGINCNVMYCVTSYSIVYLAHVII